MNPKTIRFLQCWALPSGIPKLCAESSFVHSFKKKNFVSKKFLYQLDVESNSIDDFVVTHLVIKFPSCERSQLWVNSTPRSWRVESKFHVFKLWFYVMEIEKLNKLALSWNQDRPDHPARMVLFRDWGSTNNEGIELVSNVENRGRKGFTLQYAPP